MVKASQLLCALVLAGSLSTSAANANFYSRGATRIWEEVAGSPVGLTIKSPDKMSRVIARYVDTDNPTVKLHVSGRIGTGVVGIGPGVSSEMRWAPDSRSFAVTTSDGGANGPYRTIVVSSGQGRLKVRDLSPLIVRAFGHPVKCGWREDPNIAFVRWQGSSKVIVAAEIVAHTVCDSWGTFKAYEVDLQRMRIARSFDQITAKALFGSSMGIELRNARDECIRRPRSCWVSTNH